MSFSLSDNSQTAIRILQLTGEADEDARAPRDPQSLPPRPLKILIVTPGKLLTPVSGGELRTYHLARELGALGHQVDVLAFVTRNHLTGLDRNGSGLTIQQRHSLWLDLAALADRAHLVPITELPLWLAPLRPWLRRLVGRNRYDIVQFDFPWFSSLYGAACPVPVVYGAHNIESDWWAPRLAGWSFGRRFQTRLLGHELNAITRAAGVTACSPADLAWIGAHARRPDLPIALVPNGFDGRRYRPPAPRDRERLRRDLGFAPGEKIAVFCASNTHPNREAAAAILNAIAPACAAPIRLVIVGRVGEGLALPATGGTVPITLTGPVDDVLPYLQAADVGLNPMLSGSGSNLKVAEACAAGLALVSTDFGLRGFEDLRPWVMVCPIEGFAAALSEAAWPNAIPPHVLDRFSWKSSARRLEIFYRQLQLKNR